MMRYKVNAKEKLGLKTFQLSHAPVFVSGLCHVEDTLNSCYCPLYDMINKRAEELTLSKMSLMFS